MYKNINVIILKDDKMIDIICSIAVKYDLLCTHKIGIYGDFKQHELQIIGPQRHYRKFVKELNTLDDENGN